MDAISDGAVERRDHVEQRVGKSEALDTVRLPASTSLAGADHGRHADRAGRETGRTLPMTGPRRALSWRARSPTSRDGSNKIAGALSGHLTIVGANAPSRLASRPIRILLCDEVDRYPFSACAEGDRSARRRNAR